MPSLDGEPMVASIPCSSLRHPASLCLQSLAYKCWRKDPKLRPSFAEITAYLQTMVPDKGWQVAGDSATAEGAGKQ